MRLFVVFSILLSASLLAAQPAPSPSPAAATSVTPATVGGGSVLPELDLLQTSATQTAALIGRLRIEKWKTDAESKRQAQANAQSIERNLSSALPGIIANVRSNPQDLPAQFKLYRNLNALYDVMSSLTESAGAFGPKNDYEALAAQLGDFDSSRRRVGDSVDQLAAATQSQVEQLRNQVNRMQQQAAAVAEPPKKVVVENTEAPKKASTTHKKKATTKSPASPSSGAADTSSPPK